MKSPAMASADELLLLSEYGFSLKSLVNDYAVGISTLSQREINYYTYNERVLNGTKSAANLTAHAGRQSAAIQESI